MILNFITKRGFISGVKKAKLKDMLAELIALENLSFAKIKKHSLRKLLFIANQDSVTPSDTIIKELILKKYDKCVEDLKKEIIQDIVEAGHMTVFIMFDGVSSKDKMKSKKHAVTFHWTMKER